ncbi:MAG: hypothetical protein ACI81R_003848 [Bradymonadia bacterium]|jgi:hypothetical protein
MALRTYPFFHAARAEALAEVGCLADATASSAFASMCARIDVVASVVVGLPGHAVEHGEFCDRHSSVVADAKRHHRAALPLCQLMHPHLQSPDEVAIA